MNTRARYKSKGVTLAVCATSLCLFSAKGFAGTDYVRAASTHVSVVDLAGTTVETRVLSAIRHASKTTGVALPYLLAKAYRESGFDPKADAVASTAAGMFQFTRRTWLDLFTRYGATYGYGDLVPLIKRTSRGYLSIPKTAAGRRIMNLRHDLVLAAQLAAEYTRENRRMLRRALKRHVMPEELYMAHFMGAQGAIQLLTASEKQPDALAARLFPDAAASNPQLFYSRGRIALTVLTLKRNLVRSFRRELMRFNSVSSDVLATVMPGIASAPKLRVSHKLEGNVIASEKGLGRDFNPVELKIALAKDLAPAGGIAFPWLHVRLDGRDPVRPYIPQTTFHGLAMREALSRIVKPIDYPDSPSLVPMGYRKHASESLPTLDQRLPTLVAAATLDNARQMFYQVPADRVSGKMPILKVVTGVKVAGGPMPRYVKAVSVLASDLAEAEHKATRPGA